MELVIGEFFVVCIVNIVLFAIVGSAFSLNYNGLVTHGEKLKEAWGRIEAQLQRRYDALLAMSKVVQGYSSHEQVIDSVVAKARNVVNSSDFAAKVSASDQVENQMRGFMGRIFNIATSFPELKADKHFQELLDTIRETGNVITSHRESYNKEVSVYNAYLRKYPTKLYAIALGYKEAKYFGSGTDITGDFPDLFFQQDAAVQGAAVGSSSFPPNSKLLEGITDVKIKKLEQGSKNKKKKVKTNSKSRSKKEL